MLRAGFTYMEAISAIEVFTARKPIHATRYIQIRPAVPPLMSPMMEVPSIVSQLHITNMVNPKIETKRKFRF